MSQPLLITIEVISDLPSANEHEIIESLNKSNFIDSGIIIDSRERIGSTNP